MKVLITVCAFITMIPAYLLLVMPCLIVAKKADQEEENRLKHKHYSK